MAGTFASRYEAQKEKYKKTDKYLCRRAGIATRTLRMYKADPDRMPCGVAMQLSKELGCSIGYLLEGKDDKTEDEAYRKAVKLLQKAVEELKGGEKE